MNTLLRAQALEQLKATCCRLQPSPIAGVGVFAIKDIPQGVDPFPYMHDEPWVTLTKDDVATLEPAHRALVEEFFVIEKDGTVSMPGTACSTLDISFYLNHSKEPNVEALENGFRFRTLRPIRCGEELLVNYGTYDHAWR